jgi:phasin family protein
MADASLENMTKAAEVAAAQTLEKAQGAMANYFSWFQKTMSATPWGNTDLSRKLMYYTTENMNATVAFVRRLADAKNMEDVVKLQTEFVQAQLNAFNEQARSLGETYSKAVEGVTKGTTST